MFRKYLPTALKLQYQLGRRYLREHLLCRQSFAKRQPSQFEFRHQQTWQQEIKISHFFANKTHNIDLCLKNLNGLVLHPQQIFSFWHLIPQPLAKHGFKMGRNLRQGKISEDIGGGICQVSCILYILALKNGLKILERHAHSMDIYKEHERFTPLGSDATVVYGYKDLQFQNPFNFPIMIECSREHDQLFCRFHSDIELPNYTLEFKTQLLATRKHVLTYVNNMQLTDSLYQYSE